MEPLFACANHILIDSERYFVFGSLYDRGKNLSSAQCLLRFGVRARVRACGRVSSYRGLFLKGSMQIRNNPPSFFQNTNTGNIDEIF
jgi:hypothetical protein